MEQRAGSRDLLDICVFLRPKEETLASRLAQQVTKHHPVTGSMITLTPLSEPYGKDENAKEQAEALAYLAQVDDVRILIGCGAPEEFRFQGEGGLDDILRE